MNELNPNHPVTQKVHDHWHKIVALMMRQLGKKRHVIPPREIERFAKEFGGSAVTIKFSDDDGITLELVSEAEAKRLAKEEGGLPA